MKGYQITLCTGAGRRHGHLPMAEWLMQTIRALGIRGATMTAGVEGVGRDGRLHSAHFFELADQPVEVMVAVNEAQCEQLFEALQREGADVFYVKAPVEYGVVGGPRG